MLFNSFAFLSCLSAVVAASGHGASRVESKTSGRGRIIVEKAGELPRPVEPDDLSGLSWAGGDRYWSVCDTGGELCELRIAIDLKTGRPSGFEVLRRLRVPGASDLEGVAYDPLRGSVWVSDEKGPAIFETLPTGLVGTRVELPPAFVGIRKNRGLESLEISPDGLEMWTINENALSGDATGGAGPGGREYLRLTRFVRGGAADGWRCSGQWGYRPEPTSSREARNGVASLCKARDGTLLALEREKLDDDEACFRLRVFEVDVEGATDIRGIRSLGDLGAESVFAVARKTLVYSLDTGAAMYEGFCLGPVLEDGSRALLLVSDGDGEASERILVLKIRRWGGDVRSVVR